MPAGRLAGLQAEPAHERGAPLVKGLLGQCQRPARLTTELPAAQVEPAFEHSFQEWSGRTDDLGRFSFADLPPGSYTFSTRSGGRYHRLGALELGQSEKRTDVVLTFELESGSLSGKVVDPDGVPLSLVALYLLEPTTSRNVSYTVSRSEGRPPYRERMLVSRTNTGWTPSLKSA